MKQIGTHKDIKVFYIQNPVNLNNFPKKDWICFFIANEKYDDGILQNFIKESIRGNLVEWSCCGNFGENAHLDFDLTLVGMNLYELKDKIHICSTGLSNENTQTNFWNCFYANCVKEGTDYNNLSVVSVTYDNQDYSNVLKKYLEDFENGWLPYE